MYQLIYSFTFSWAKKLSKTKIVSDFCSWPIVV